MYGLLVERVSGKTTFITSDDSVFLKDQLELAKSEPQGRKAKDPISRVRIFVISHVLDEWFPTQLLGRQP